MTDLKDVGTAQGGGDIEVVPHGIVTFVGWVLDQETGDDVFEARVRFPDGPPNLPSSIVWQAQPVDIVPRGSVSERSSLNPSPGERE